jgi:hypothetical protein
MDGATVIGPEGHEFFIDPLSAVVREWSNGAWFVSSIILLAALVRYIWGYWGPDHPFWWRNPGVQMAGALIILMTGHSVRALVLWLQFILVNAGDSPWFWSHWSVYLGATLFIITGKALCLLAVAPWRWRACMIWGMVLASVLVPLVVLFVV